MGFSFNRKSNAKLKYDIIAFVLLTFSQSVWSQQTEKDLEWPAQLWQRIKQESQVIGMQLNTTLFDSFSSLDFGLALGEQFSLGFKNKRVIFNNRDVLGSYTVIESDTITVAKTFPLFQNFLQSAANTLGAGVNLEIIADSSQIFSNIRVVSASERRAIKVGKPIVDDLIPDAKTLPTALAGVEVLELEPLPQDPRNRPRFGKILKRLIFPVYAPWNINRVRKMPDGDIFSYSVNARLGVRTGIGSGLFGFLPGKIGNGYLLSGGKVELEYFSFGGAAATLIQYSYSLFKETERFVRVKISPRVYVAESVGGSLGRVRLNLFDSKTLEVSDFSKTVPAVRYTTRLAGFGLESSNAIVMKDRIFRYDLDSPEARAALLSSRFFNLGPTLQLIEKAKSGPPAGSGFSRSEPVVIEVLSKDGEDATKRAGYDLPLFGLGRVRKERKSAETNVDLKTAGGKRHVDQSVYTRSFSYRLPLGRAESRTNQLTITSDNKLGSFLSIEKTIDDARTRTLEYNKYTRLAQLMTGRVGVFPPAQESRKLYGRTYLNFGFHLVADDLLELQKMTQEDWNQKVDLVLSLLEKDSKTAHRKLYRAFEFLKAWSISESESHSLNSTAIDDDEPTTENHKKKKSLSGHQQLEDFLTSHRYRDELMCVVRAALWDRPLDVFLTVESSYAGRRYERSSARPSLERIFRWLKPDANFGDLPIDGRGFDYGLRLSDLGFSSDKKTFSFVATDSFEWIYLNVSVLESNGEFVPLRELTLHKDETLFRRGRSELGLGLLDLGLKSGKTYRIRVSAARSSYNWSAPVDWQIVWP